MSEVTDWVPCTTPPVRAGKYDIQRRDALGNVVDERRCRWSPQKAAFMHPKGWKMAIIETQDYWRGLASPGV